MKLALLVILAASPALAHLQNSVWTAADFDGDRRPDIVRLDVTRHALLLPVDLDHDADLDLVLHEAFTDRPLAIWLNDGHGRFTRDASPRRLPQENRSLWQASPAPSAPPVDVPRAAELVPVFVTAVARPASFPLPARRLPLSRSLESAAARGPPPSYT